MTPKQYAANELAEAAVAWAEDTRDCHFCGNFQVYAKHDSDCPVQDYLNAKVEDEPAVEPQQLFKSRFDRVTQDHG